MGKSKTKSKFILGAILGATAAALLTPVAGKKTRENLIKIGKDMGLDTDAIGEKARELKQEIETRGADFIKAQTGITVKNPAKRRAKAKTNSKNK